MSTVYGKYAAHGFSASAVDDWRGAALCRQADPELWFPVGHAGPALEQEALAKSICHGCPVETECLKWALDNDIDDGVWGGLSELERRALRNPKPELSAGRRHALERSAQVRAEKAAARTHCDAGHELTPENTITDRSYRVCRTCRKEQQREYRLRQAVGSDA